MKVSGLKNHIDGNNEITCPRCANSSVFIRNVAMRAHENGMTVEIDLGCTNCDDKFQLELTDGTNTSVYGYLKIEE
ncbi:hypothetical protein V5031_21355 [Enterobacter kobei]|uniref:Uncharacterized protein n=1 Tax=Enterobacter asburiae TaxID=61645 RepID=A0A376FF58_ENTAS|nr:hypothetical protein [Enterobacter asburiae]AMA06292.1 hypothetical protein ACJ69_23010 [Enterobacter asburiae]QPS67836.1 hypothetical protein I6G49_23220 [Enterobacter asburiae]WKE01816.1 hypothetical protein QOM25_13100 [Enterobacter asburiae]WKE07876.1 hypothetical protein QOM24_17535 [Enterobacter asburiae]STD21604.1 Uncharacterised protein [Enterobacter asburiae]